MYCFIFFFLITDIKLSQFLLFINQWKFLILFLSYSIIKVNKKVYTVLFLFKLIKSAYYQL